MSARTQSLMMKSLMVKAGRLVPQIARLHDERNALIQRVADLERRLAPPASSDTLEAEVARLRAELDHVTARRSQGFLIELDYACAPRVRQWADAEGKSPCGSLLARGHDRYRERLASFCAHANWFTAIGAAEPTDEREPYWSNPWLPPLDAICLSALVADLNPRRYVEVGSGNSTKYVRRAIIDHGLRTRIISIDPHPRAIIDQLCDTIVRKRLEDVDLAMFSELDGEDMLFIDNSHRSFQNSDVTVFFTEILPRLRSGCTYGIHDIFLPNDYPAEWLSRYYNEQYLLMAYLLGGAGGDEIVMPIHYVQRMPDLLSILDQIIRHPALSGTDAVGGSFWLRKA